MLVIAARCLRVTPLWHAVQDDGHAHVATLRLVPAMLKPPQPSEIAILGHIDQHVGHGHAAKLGGATEARRGQVRDQLGQEEGHGHPEGVCQGAHPTPSTHPRRPMSMLPMCRDSGVAAESRGVVAAALCPRGTMAKRRLAHTLVGSLALYRLLIPSSFEVEPAAGASESSPGDSAAVAAAGVQAAAAAMATVKAELV